MSEEILNEIVEETEVLEEETTTEETEGIIELPPQRVNPFCVISKNTFGDYNVRDIQTNSAWEANPYEDYAVVPDDMVTEIMETRGFCDIVLNEDGTEVVVYTTSGVAVGNATITNGNATVSTGLAKGEIAVISIAGKGIKVVMQ